MSVRIEDGLTAKQRHAKKKYDAAPMIDCACGCGEQLKSVDKYARVAKYINGHNARIKLDGTNQTNWEVQKRWRENNPEKVREYKTQLRRRKKVDAIQLKGSCCVECGMAFDGRNAAVFDFHHLDPQYKEDNLAKMLRNASWERVVKELEGCVLVCANCHRMLHNQGEDNGTVEDYGSPSRKGRGFGSDQDLGQ